MSCERCGSQTPNKRLCRECQLLERAEEETARSHAPPLYQCQECGEERAESPDSTCWLCRSDRHERGDDGSPEPVSESDEIATDGGEDLKETTAQEKLDALKNNRKKALRAEKTLDDAPPEADGVEARTAARFIGTFDGIPMFQIVTTQLSSFPIGRDMVDEYTEDELERWVEAQEPDVIDLADEVGFRTNAECGMPQCVGTKRHRTHACKDPEDQLLHICDACLNSGWRANVEVLD